MQQLQQGFDFPLLQMSMLKSEFSLPASVEEGLYTRTSTLPAFTTTLSQTTSPVLLSSWTAFGGKALKSMDIFSCPSPSPSSLFWASAFPGGHGWAIQAFPPGSSRKQRDTKERASKKTKLMRVTSTAWDLEFPFLWGIPQFCKRLLFLLDLNQ